MTCADVIVTKEPCGLTCVELVKHGRLLKSIRFMVEEWESLTKQILPKEEINPIDVVIAKFQRLENADAHCVTIYTVLESLERAKRDPKEMIRKEKLETMMEKIEK